MFEILNTSELPLPDVTTHPPDEGGTVSLAIPVSVPVGARMAVLGVGGGGGNAVSRMIEEDLAGVRFIVANTDQQALGRLTDLHEDALLSRTLCVLPIGVGVTRGLGSGGRPDVGRKAVEESIETVAAAIEGLDLLFLTAGLGGGTGTGAIPVIAARAREMGILVVAIVTTPFPFESRRRMEFAEHGLGELMAAADTVIVVPNAKLQEVAPAGTSFQDSLKLADTVLLNATRGVSGILVRAGEINTDFADIRTIMGGGGAAILGSGSGSGEHAAVEAAEAAVTSPLLDSSSLAGATRLLVNVRGSRSLDAASIARAAHRIQESADPDAEIIFGMDFDPDMADSVEVTVIATGFVERGVRVESETRLAATPRLEAEKNAPTPEAVTPASGKVSVLRRIFRKGASEAEVHLSDMPAKADAIPSYLRREGATG